MLQRRGELDLALESPDGESRRLFRREHLDHDAAVERALRRQENARHPPAAEFTLDDVAMAEAGLELFA